jgi:hypothetical protein
MFWPILPWKVVTSKLDHMNQPHVVQPYIVPPPSHDAYHQHDEAVYSLWMHFIDFCLATNSRNDFSAPELSINHYTKRSRLSIFRVLSSASGTSSSSSPSYPPSTSSFSASSSRLMTVSGNMFGAEEGRNNISLNYQRTNVNNGEMIFSSSNHNNHSGTSLTMASPTTITTTTALTTSEEIDEMDVLLENEKVVSDHDELTRKENHISSNTGPFSSQSPDSPSSLWQNHKSLPFAAATQLGL